MLSINTNTLTIIQLIIIVLFSIVLIFLISIRNKIKDVGYRSRKDIELFISLSRIIDGKVPLCIEKYTHGLSEFLLVIVQFIDRFAPERIVVCGAGTTTVVLAAALRGMNQKGHIYALEHNVIEAEKLRQQLEAQNLTLYVTIAAAPEVEKNYADLGLSFRWYDLENCAEADLLCDIDLLVVNAPERGRLALDRFPVATELFPRLSPDAHVFMNDPKRRADRKLTRLWRRLYPDLGIREHSIGRGVAEMFFLDKKIDKFMPDRKEDNA